jgi:hypothetical protein
LYFSPAETNDQNIASDAAKHASLTGASLQPEYEKNENVVFHNQVPGTSLSYAPLMDETFMDGHTTDTDLACFLQRPVKIASYSWSEGSKLYQTLNPWYSFFNYATIRDKTQTFAFMRCKLKIHVQINASPFYFGRALVAYRPLPDWGPESASFSGDEVETVVLSQRPSFWINAADSQGGDMELPFVYHRNWITLGDHDQLTKMGQLDILSPTVLKNANSVSGADVQVIVWAMATDVVLSGSTTVPQSSIKPLKSSDKVSRSRAYPGKAKSKIIKTSNSNSSSSDAVSILHQVNNGFKDEYGKGVISATASALADAANVVSSVPVVGPFATATATAASCVAGVADYFGWTNVPNVANTEPVKNQPFPAFSSPSISTPVEKLSVDPKNELCVDSRTVGLDGSDELSIEDIVTRESYLKTVTCAESQAVGTILFTSLVLPALSRIVTESINSRDYKKHYCPPMMHVSQLFRFWRGDISFRFVANKTRYHAGRVMISWDPIENNCTGNYPTQTHAAIWDFTQSDEFVFTVPYNQADPWLQCKTILPTDGEVFKTDGTTLGGPDVTSGGVIAFSNGSIVMNVLTQVTGPATGANIDIMVFVRGCPNLKFNDPIQINKYGTAWRPQSSVEKLDTAQISIETKVSALSLVTMGEDHISLRPLLHRTTEYIKAGFSSDTTSLIKYANFNLPRLPLVPGFDPSGFHVTNLTGSPRYNYLNQSAYSWLAPMFLGMRGSVTYHVNASSPELVDSLSIVRSHRALTTSEYSRNDNVATGVNDSVLNLHSVDNDEESGMTGMAITNQKTQAGLSANIPMYSRFRMVPTLAPGIGYTDLETRYDSFRVICRLNPAASGKNANLSYITIYYNMGPDFNFFYFLNAPILYYSDPPSATP